MSPKTMSTKLSYVPDSSPGAVTSSDASGYGALLAPNSSPSSASSSAARSFASLQFAKPSDSGPSSAYRSRKLRQVTSVFSAEVMTEMPSIGHEQLDVLDAGLLAQRNLLVADGARGVADVDLAIAEERESVARTRASTVYWKSELSAAKASATAFVIGSTVEDPDTKISPAAAPPPPPSDDAGVDPSGSSDSVPVLLWQAASTSISTTPTPSSDRHHVRFTVNPSSMSGNVCGWHAIRRAGHSGCTASVDGARP